MFYGDIKIKGLVSEDPSKNSRSVKTYNLAELVSKITITKNADPALIKFFNQQEIRARLINAI